MVKVELTCNIIIDISDLVAIASPQDQIFYTGSEASMMTSTFLDIAGKITISTYVESSTIHKLDVYKHTLLTPPHPPAKVPSLRAQHRTKLSETKCQSAPSSPA